MIKNIRSRLLFVSIYLTKNRTVNPKTSISKISPILFLVKYEEPLVMEVSLLCRLPFMNKHYVKTNVNVSAAIKHRNLQNLPIFRFYFFR